MRECPKCGAATQPSDVYCRQNHFLGYPNRREAERERGRLLERYECVRTACNRKHLKRLLKRLMRLAKNAAPAIAMPFEVCDAVFRSRKYLNYYQSIHARQRSPAGPVHHADREKVSAQLFPAYHQHIVYAALSPDDRGLENYGSVMVFWDGNADYVDRRTSLLEENSYRFYERHDLGRLGAVTPVGYRSVWKDRAKLAAAKLGPRFSPATNLDELASLLLHSEPGDREKDDFIEIAVYADDGLDLLDVDRVVVQVAPTTLEERRRLAVLRERCSALGKHFRDR